MHHLLPVTDEKETKRVTSKTSEGTARTPCPVSLTLPGPGTAFSRARFDVEVHQVRVQHMCLMLDGASKCDCVGGLQRRRNGQLAAWTGLGRMGFWAGAVFHDTRVSPRIRCPRGP